MFIILRKLNSNRPVKFCVMLGRGQAPFLDPTSITKQQFSKPVAVWCKIHCNRPIAEQRSDVKIVPQLINYARINARRRRFRWVVLHRGHGDSKLCRSATVFP